jgi:hypothetical protein
LIVSLAAGLLIGALSWIDPLFLPLALVGPIVGGAVCAARNVPFTWLATAWATGGDRRYLEREACVRLPGQTSERRRRQVCDLADHFLR